MVRVHEVIVAMVVMYVDSATTVVTHALLTDLEQSINQSINQSMNQQFTSDLKEMEPYCDQNCLP